MAEVDETIEVNVPVSTAYNQWTQFEYFPQFMENVVSVTQVDDKHLHWVAEIAGKRHEWDAEIIYQHPDRDIVWRSTDGKTNTGNVEFRKAGDEKTQLRVRMTWEPEGVAERVGDAAGADERGVRADLQRFKELVESRGRETGAWRGEIEGGEVVEPDPAS